MATGTRPAVVRGRASRPGIRTIAAGVLVAVGALALGPMPASAVRSAADVATGISIYSNYTTIYVGKTVTLSGDVVPGQEPGSGQPSPLAGKIAVVYVMKPGKTYWSYSSNRVIYDCGNVSAGWQYKYYFKPAMAKGYYKFKACIPKYAGYLPSQSAVRTIRAK